MNQTCEKKIEGVEKFQDLVNCHSYSKNSRPNVVYYVRKSDCPCLVESMGVMVTQSINQPCHSMNGSVDQLQMITQSFGQQQINNQ